MVYICPAAGGAYNHKRCKYFGVYRNKTVSKIGLIEAVLDVKSADSAEIKWKNISIKDSDIKKTAITKMKLRHSTDYPKRIFLLGDLFNTNFIKNSKGGMRQSKRYCDVGSLNVSSSKELAEQLNGKSWS
jgi:hypothetical protein